MAKNRRRRTDNPTSTSIDSAAAFRRAIHAKGDVLFGISQHRRAIPVDKIPSIVSDLMRVPVYRNILTPEPTPRTYDRLRPRYPMTTCGRSREIVWAASVLKHYAATINSFLELKRGYSEALLTESYSDASAFLDEIERKYGVSLWLLSSRLVVVQASEGLEAQKNLLSEVMQLRTINVATAYLAFFFSYSLEDGVTASDVRRQASDGDSNAELTPFFDYFRFHILPSDLSSIRDPINCIWMEETSSIIDRFETFCDVSAILFGNSDLVDELRIALSELSDIADDRVQNLRFMLGLDDCLSEDGGLLLECCDLYTEGRNGEAFVRIEKALTANPSRVWLFELLARAAWATEADLAGGPTRRKITSEIQSFVEVTKELSRSRAALEKSAFLLRKLPAARFVASILDRQLDLPVVRTPTTNEKVWALSGPLVQPQSLKVLTLLEPGIVGRIVHAYPPSLRSTTFALHRACIGTPGGDLASLAVPASRLHQYSAYQAYNMGDNVRAVAELELYKASVSGAPRPRTITFEYALFAALGDITQALRAFVDSYFSNPLSPALYPLEELAAWAIKEADANSASLDRAILMHVALTEFSIVKPGDLSDACEDVLDFFGVDRPSDLVSCPIDRKRLLYFLRFVATVERLEDTTKFESVDEIESERIRSLQWLVANDSAGRTAYTQEISSITKEQEIARFSAQIERTKIYVHEDGIRRFLETAIRSSFDRYRQLLAEPRVGDQIEKIEQRFRKILKDTDSELRRLVIPSSERDGIFYSMVQTAFDALVLDPNHGFKTYLSTRILHGVLEGELRSSFMAEDLLLAAGKDKLEDEFIERWHQRLPHMTDGEMLQIAQLVVKFSERITEAIARLKDKRIRVWAKGETPEGLFLVSLSGAAYQKLKDSVTATTTYPEFVERVIATFWDSLDECLRDVRAEINGPFRRQVGAAFDALAASLAPFVARGVAGELADAMARCQANFSHHVERVSSWFVRAGTLTAQPFAVQTGVHLAARITNNCYPTYPIAPVITGGERLRIDGEMLNPMVDLMTNCFQNAAEHAGFVDGAPAVAVTFSQDQADGGLRVEIETELAEGLDIAPRRAIIEALLNEDDNADPTAVAREGKTGIRKMKRILKYDLQSGRPLNIEVLASRRVAVSFSIPKRYVHEDTAH